MFTLAVLGKLFLVICKTHSLTFFRFWLNVGVSLRTSLFILRSGHLPSPHKCTDLISLASLDVFSFLALTTNGLCILLINLIYSWSLPLEYKLHEGYELCCFVYFLIPSIWDSTWHKIWYSRAGIVVSSGIQEWTRYTSSVLMTWTF